MALSKKWDLSDNAYSNSKIGVSPFNNGCMCMFEDKFDGRVNRCVAIFAKQNGRKQGLLYNNRLYLGVANPSEKEKKQYEANRLWILNM